MDWKKLRRKIPHRVQIAKDAWYEIVWVDDFKDGKTLGETRHDPRQIAILNGQSPKMTVVTYLHELMHAFCNENEADLTETQVLAFEKSFYYMLKADNLFVDKK
jgi:hypothetical protein